MTKIYHLSTAQLHLAVTIFFATAFLCFASPASAQLPCAVNGITYTQQTGFGTNNKVIIGGYGTNDGAICWNCYSDSTTFGRHRAYNMPTGAYNANAPVPSWSSRIFQDITAGVLRIQSGRANCYDSITWKTGLSILKNGGVGIGTDNTFGALLAVNGQIYARSDVKINATLGWPDYVFTPEYKLPTITEYEKQVTDLGYIPQIGSGKAIEENGLLLGEMQTRQMEVMEMMLRYQFIMNHRLDSLEQANTKLSNRLTRYATIDSLFTVAQAATQTAGNTANDTEKVKQTWLQLLDVLMKKEND